MGTSDVPKNHVRRRVVILTTLFSLCYVVIYLSAISNTLVQTYLICDSEVCDPNVKRFNVTHFRNKTTKHILLWTKFFMTDKWHKTINSKLQKSKYKCSVSLNKNDIKSADAVMFHYLDLWFWEKVPSYRDKHQVWVLFNAEPTTFVHPTGLSSYKNMFNWTISYRKTSTIYAPYGEFKPLDPVTKEAMIKRYSERNIAREKSKMVAAIYSDCADNARRYDTIKELSKYVELDFYGDCGDKFCPFVNASGSCKSNKYRFRISFENSHCRDYVTEKFFEPIQADIIPIVNWKKGQGLATAPNMSYINVYDFKSLKDLGDYLIYLSKNEDKYNEYFKWKMNYSYYNDLWTNFKDLCEALHQPREAQVVIKPDEWISNDICNKWSIFSAARRKLDSWRIDLGL